MSSFFDYLGFDILSDRSYRITFIIMVVAAFLQVYVFGLLGLGVWIGACFYLGNKVWFSDKRINIKPTFTGTKNWVNATNTEIKKIHAAAEKFAEKTNNKACGCFAGVMAIPFLLVPLAGGLITSIFGYSTFALVLQGISSTIIIGVMVYYLLFSSSSWYDNDLVFKVPHFQSLRKTIHSLNMNDWEGQWQIERSESDLGHLPTDVKVILKPSNCPSEFLGIQAQLSQNRGQPYLYFVIITKPELKISGLRPTNDTYSEKKQSDVNILVIRKTTSKTVYSTNVRDVERLLEAARDIALDTIC